MANMDKLGSMLEKKWDKVKPRCTSLKMTGIKAGYGVSKKKERVYGSCVAGQRRDRVDGQ
eukprot:Skav231158  [mRNA]  locus=scaffold3252:79299:79935:- [translate_table: standard]